MDKDFLVITPDTGTEGETTVTVAASENTATTARNSTITIGTAGISKTVSVSQTAGTQEWRYTFIVQSSYQAKAAGEVFTPNIQSSKQLYINGKPSGNAQAVSYTRTNVTGWNGYQDYSVSITNNMANSAKSGSVTYTQAESGKTGTCSITQSAGVQTTQFSLTTEPASAHSTITNKGSLTIVSLKKILWNGKVAQEQGVAISFSNNRSGHPNNWSTQPEPVDQDGIAMTYPSVSGGIRGRYTYTVSNVIVAPGTTLPVQTTVYVGQKTVETGYKTLPILLQKTPYSTLELQSMAEVAQVAAQSDDDEPVTVSETQELIEEAPKATETSTVTSKMKKELLSKK